MQCEGRSRFFTETPLFYQSYEVQSFIEQETKKPSKVWAHEVVEGKRENDSVRLRTPDFVLLPDLTPARRQHRPVARDAWNARCSQSVSRPQRYPKPVNAAWAAQKYGLTNGAEPDAWAATQTKDAWAATQIKDNGALDYPSKSLNWLVIVTDPLLRSIRDLRGEHVKMLEEMYEQCVSAIQREYKIGRSDIMVFANYPPSVYRLHFHFCAPFFTSSPYDAFRMHPFSTVMNNLRVCPDYYKLSVFQVPLHVGSELFRITNTNDEEASEREAITM